MSVKELKEQLVKMMACLEAYDDEDVVVVDYVENSEEAYITVDVAEEEVARYDF